MDLILWLTIMLSSSTDIKKRKDNFRTTDSLSSSKIFAFGRCTSIRLSILPCCLSQTNPLEDEQGYCSQDLCKHALFNFFHRNCVYNRLLLTDYLLKLQNSYSLIVYSYSCDPGILCVDSSLHYFRQIFRDYT